MHKLSYRITTTSPLLLATGGGASHFSTTREYIRGTIILGMFAGTYIRKKGLQNAHEDETFRQWFLQGPLSFGNGYINGALPVPLSLRSDKEDEQTAYDGLLIEESGQTKGIAGFGTVRDGQMLKEKVKRSMNYHHQHDVKTGTVAKGIFFNYEAIEAGQEFRGDILGPEQTLIAFKKEFESQEFFYIGRSRNTQYGKIKLEFSAEPGPLVLASEAHDSVIAEAGTNPVTMTLLSPLILYNQWGFSTSDCDELAGLFNGNGNKEGRIRIKKSYVKTGEIDNFISVWKLKRPAEVCFTEGSCFEISGLQPGDEPMLRQMLSNGIGERTKEGFGRVMFNLNGTAQLVVTERKDNAVDTRLTVPPETQKILEEIIRNTFLQVVMREAIEKSSEFKELGSKSILTRLTSMLKSPKEPVKTFKRNVNNLRKTAKDNLEACDNGRITLLQFITDTSICQSSLPAQNKGIIRDLEHLLSDNKFPDGFKDNFLADSTFGEELTILYFETFFTAMRKRKQAGEE